MSIDKKKVFSNHSTLLCVSHVDCLLCYLLLITITSKIVFELCMCYYLHSRMNARYTSRVCQLGLELV